MGLRDRLRNAPFRSKSSAPLRSSESRSSVMMSSTVGPSSSTLRSRMDDYLGGATAVVPSEDERRLGRFYNIAFAGAGSTGKSKLINALVGKHIAQEKGTKRSTGNEPTRYKHPQFDEVWLHEFPVEVAARKDFKPFHLVVVVFYGSLKELDMEVARRASERDVPVLFVHPRADMVLSRQIRIGGASQNEAVRGVRKLVNKHADKAWYQLSENDRRVYIVSSLDIERGNEGTFDEADLVAKFSSFLQKRREVVDEVQSGLAESVRVHEASLTPGSINVGAILINNKHAPVRSSSRRASNQQPSQSRSYSQAEVVCHSSRSFGAPAVSRGRREQPTSLIFSDKDVSPFHIPVNNDSSRIAFLEDIDLKSSSRTTLMEAFLGFLPDENQSSNRTIAQHTPYQHPEYPNATFYFFSTNGVTAKQTPQFFQTYNLSLMRLLVVVVNKNLRDNDIVCIKEASRYGVDVICVQVKTDPMSAVTEKLSTIQKIKSFGSSSHDVATDLAKNRIDNVRTFSVNPRILRIPDSYPKADEEDLRRYIAATSGGRVVQPSSPGHSILRRQCDEQTFGGRGGSVRSFQGTGDSDTDTPDGRSRTPSVARSTGFVSASTRAPSQSTSGRNTNSGRNTMIGGTNSVTFNCRQDILVAFVGASGCGKSTLVKNTLGLKPGVLPVSSSSSGKSGPISIRHPSYYDIIVRDYPGYDPHDINVGTDRWLHQQRLQSMDWIIIVFHEKLSRVRSHSAYTPQHTRRKHTLLRIWTAGTSTPLYYMHGGLRSSVLLCVQTDLAIAAFAEQTRIPVVFVGNKCDVSVERLVYDQNMMEKAAIQHTKFSILQNFRQSLEQNRLGTFPLYLVIGRSLDKRRAKSENAGLFDEAAYFEMGELAHSSNASI